MATTKDMGQAAGHTANPGTGEFSKGGMSFRVRQTTQSEIRQVRDLVNREAMSSMIVQFLEDLERQPELETRLRSELKKMASNGDRADKDMARAHAKAFGAAQTEVFKALSSRDLEEPFVDFVSSDEAASWVRSGLSFVATVVDPVTGNERIVAHMCGRELESVIGRGEYFEIKAGLVDPEFRDGKEVPPTDRLDLQNRNRFALLSEMYARLPDKALIVSISKQSKVKGPLEASGFEKNPELQAPLGGILWPPWAARIVTVDIGRAALANADTPEDYNNMIAEKKSTEEKVRRLQRVTEKP